MNMAKSVETSSQFKMLPQHIQDLINQDMMTNGSADNGATPFSFSMSPGEGIPRAVQGTVFKDDMPAYNGTVGPLTVADVMPERPAAEPKSGALSAVMGREAPTRPRPLDFEEMLQRHVPKDDSSRRYLALAAALTMPTRTGSFGETMHNVASAMMQEKDNQQKLRAQYTPLIMQQIAAQQTREEQAAYRMEAQQQALIAQRLAAQQAQQGRMDLAAQNQAAMNERAAADRASREAMAMSARENRPEPAPHYIVGADGTQLIVDKSGRARPVLGADNAPVKTKTLQTSMPAAMQKELLESDDAVQSGKVVTGLLGKALELNDVAYSGYGAKPRAVLRSNLPGQSSEADATINLDNIMTGQALESLKSTFGAAPTEGERKILMDIQASADKTPAQRRQIIERAIAAAQTRAGYAAKKAQAIRDGSYLTQGVEPQPQSGTKSVSWGDLK